MNLLIEVERGDLDRERVSIMEAEAENLKKIKSIENEILQVVSTAGSDLFDDDKVTDALSKSR